MDTGKHPEPDQPSSRDVLRNDPTNNVIKYLQNEIVGSDALPVDRLVFQGCRIKERTQLLSPGVSAARFRGVAPLPKGDGRGALMKPAGANTGCLPKVTP